MPNTSDSKKPYKLVANIGQYNAPFEVSHELGSFISDEEATSAANTALESIYQKMDWKLVCDNARDVSSLRSRLNTDKGYVLSIQLHANELTGFAANLDIIKEQVEDFYIGGGQTNETNAYEYDLAGKELLESDVESCLIEGTLYVIFDTQGILFGSTSSDDISALWVDSKETHEKSGEVNILAKNVELNYAQNIKGKTYHAISATPGTIYSGSIESIMEKLASETQDFYLYMEMESTNSVK